MKHSLLISRAAGPDFKPNCGPRRAVVRHPFRLEAGRAFAVATASPEPLVKLVCPELNPESLPDLLGELGSGSRISKIAERAGGALQRSLNWFAAASGATVESLCAVTGLTGAICRHRHKGHHSLHQIEYGGGYVRVCNLCQHACCVKR